MKLPKESVFEVNIEHPTKPELTALGYRWTTIPAISNFKMNLGGVLYQNMPFNGWFMSTEIVRNLMERHDAGPAICNALGIDMTADPMWRQLATSELEKAVLHSFQKGGTRLSIRTPSDSSSARTLVVNASSLAENAQRSGVGLAASLVQPIPPGIWKCETLWSSPSTTIVLTVCCCAQV